MDEEVKKTKIEQESTILSASCSMLGFCFVVISYLNATGYSKKTNVDEMTTVAMVAFMMNCVLSFLALRSSRFQSQSYINLTTYIFLTGVLIMFCIVVLIAFGLSDSGALN